MMTPQAAEEYLRTHPEEFEAYLQHYVMTELFKLRVADVIARQKGGEDLSLEQIAEALHLPIEIVAAQMAQTINDHAGRILGQLTPVIGRTGAN
jgi:hypothetical protein